MLYIIQFKYIEKLTNGKYDNVIYKARRWYYCKYLEDGKSALMFKRGDAVGLSKVLHKAINHYDEFESMRKNGRAIYEQVYTKEIFKQKLQELMENKL